MTFYKMSWVYTNWFNHCDTNYNKSINGWILYRIYTSLIKFCTKLWMFRFLTRQNIIIQLLVDSYAWIMSVWQKLFEVSCLCQLLRYKLIVNQLLVDSLCWFYMCSTRFCSRIGCIQLLRYGLIVNQLIVDDCVWIAGL